MSWSAEVPATREVLEAIEADPLAFEDLLSHKLREAIEREQAMQRLTEAMGAAIEAVLEYRTAVRRNRHRQLFGHPLARVFIFGDRLAVIHPGGAA